MVEKHRILSLAKILFNNESALLASDIKLNMQAGYDFRRDQSQLLRDLITQCIY